VVEESQAASYIWKLGTVESSEEFDSTCATISRVFRLSRKIPTADLLKKNATVIL
jgi:hypothetical protein